MASFVLASCADEPQDVPEPWEAAGRAAEESYRTQQMEQATAGFGEALRLAQQAGSKTGQMNALEGLAASHASSGKLDAADSLYSVLLQQQQRQFDADSLSGMVLIRTLGSLGQINLGRGDIPRAELFFSSILELDHTGRVDLRAEEPALAFALQGLAEVLAAKGQTSAADSLRSRAIGLLRYGQGFSFYVGGDLAHAEEAWQQALEQQMRSPGTQPDVARTAHALGQLFALQGRRDDAIEQYRHAAEIYAASGSSPIHEARVLEDLASLLQTQEPASSDSLRQRAARVRRSMGS
ncbi:MAG: tetratricopeptide repeat protein [bacterium]|nr:tetratricopeptide repeat protein [bacterium]